MADVKKRKRKFSILLKTVIIVVVLAIVLVEISMTYYSIVASNRNNETYCKYTESLSDTVALIINKDEYDLIESKVEAIYKTIPAKEVVTSEEEDESLLETYM